MSNRMPPILNNPVVMWAVHPADQGRIDYIDGMTDAWPKLPQPGDHLTVPFLVDPASREPVAVVVTEVRPVRHQGKDVLAVLVTRSH